MREQFIRTANKKNAERAIQKQLQLPVSSPKHSMYRPQCVTPAESQKLDARVCSAFFASSLQILPNPRSFQ